MTSPQDASRTIASDVAGAAKMVSEGGPAGGSPLAESRSHETSGSPRRTARSVGGQGLTYGLSAEVQGLKEDLHRTSGGRAAKTLVKDGNLRAALILLRAGTVLDPHAIAGGASLQVLEGQLRVSLDGQEQTLGCGDLMVFGENLRAPVEALEDAALLLTVGWPDGAGAWDFEAVAGHLS